MAQWSKRTGTPRKPVTTKIVDDLRTDLEAAALANSRTLGAEIEHRLRASFSADQRTLIREEVRAAMDEHEANLAVARVRRSAALEELARLDSACWTSVWSDAEIAVVKASGLTIGGPAINKIRA